MERFKIGTRVQRDGNTGKVVRSFKSGFKRQGIVVRWDDALYDSAYTVPVEGPCEFKAEGDGQNL